MKAVIELVKTAQGYSIVEDGHEINKVSNRSTKEKQYNSAPKSMLFFTQSLLNKILPSIPTYTVRSLIILKSIL